MNEDKKKILIYCQHSLGMGHLVRSLALAENLTADFRVRLLNGGRFPKRLPVPTGPEIFNLPPVGLDKNHRLVSGDRRRSVERAIDLRKEILLEQFRTFRPDILLIELFPFGRKKFSGELLPLLEEAKGRARIVCSLRDILVGRPGDQESFERRALETANRFFDAILIHSDENFARFEDSFKNRKELRTPIFYTGFVVPGEDKRKVGRKSGKTKKIIVSAGGGIVGEKLLRTSIKAHQILSRDGKVETTVVTGLFLPEENFQKLKAETNRIRGLKLIRFVPDLRDRMARSDVSVSQGGYNTTFDILLSGVAGIVIPYSENGEDEQQRRAEKLQKIGALRVLRAEGLTGRKLASGIKNAFSFQPTKFSPDIEGGKNSAKILQDILPGRRAKTNGEKSWLRPVREILTREEGEVRIFFRDDDAGLGDERLFSLLDIFEKYRMRLDLAAIPKAVTRELAGKLTDRIRRSNGLFSVHQHGFAHVNHEPDGRKCEFGKRRTTDRQFEDVSDGKKILSELFGPLVQPIFTPPWNRCTNATAGVLRDLGFQILSRESEAERLDLNGLLEVPVSIDWFAKRKGVFLEKEQIGRMLAGKIAGGKAFGIMLHHAETDAVERENFEGLCRLLAGFSRVKFISMLDLAAERQKGASVGMDCF
ncbi:MAG: glycosyltransferase [Pyrinomonadaceae bacterium]